MCPLPLRLSFSITINNTGFTWFTWTSLTLCDHVFLLTTFWRTYCNFSVHSSLPSVLFLALSASLWEGREEGVCWLVPGKPPALQGEDGRIPLCWWVKLRYLLYCFMVLIDTYTFFHFVVFLICFVFLIYVNKCPFNCGTNVLVEILIYTEIDGHDVEIENCAKPAQQWPFSTKTQK